MMAGIRGGVDGARDDERHVRRRVTAVAGRWRPVAPSRSWSGACRGAGAPTPQPAYTSP